MTIEDLIEQWHKRAGEGTDVSFGLKTAAEELEEWLREHRGEVVLWARWCPCFEPS